MSELPDEWPPKKARTMEAWAAYWARQRWDRRFRHYHIGPFLSRWKRRLWATPRLRLRQVRWFVQRGRRGWADRDMWSLDGYLCRVAGETVARLRDTGHGYPCSCVHTPGDDGIYRAPASCTCAADYQAALTAIAGPLLAYDTHWEFRDDETWQDHAAREKQIMDAAAGAFRLLADHLPSLWD
jgi:hypothetical protein